VESGEAVVCCVRQCVCDFAKCQAGVEEDSRQVTHQAGRWFVGVGVVLAGGVGVWFLTRSSWGSWPREWDPTVQVVVGVGANRRSADRAYL
jgi:hypothetical protein